MSTSSGQYVGEYIDNRLCATENEFGEVCYFDGEVEVYYDPELYVEWWACPECQTEHESDWEYDLD